MRVLGVRIAWHVTRPTSSTVKCSTAARAGDEQVGCTQLQFLGSAGAARSVVVVPTPTDPMGILKSTRDLKAPGAVKEHTNEV